MISLKKHSKKLKESKYLRWTKGQNLSIKTIAVIVLGIMVVVLVYSAFSGWFDNVVQNFTGNTQYPDPRS